MAAVAFSDSFHWYRFGTNSSKMGLTSSFIYLLTPNTSLLHLLTFPTNTRLQMRACGEQIRQAELGTEGTDSERRKEERGGKSCAQTCYYIWKYYRIWPGFCRPGLLQHQRSGQLSGVRELSGGDFNCLWQTVQARVACGNPCNTPAGPGYLTCSLTRQWELPIQN